MNKRVEFPSLVKEGRTHKSNMVAHFNPSIKEVEAEDLWIQGYPRLYSETLLPLPKKPITTNKDLGYRSVGIARPARQK